MTIDIVQVDAFTNIPFAGNPAAVCVLTSPQETEWMQNVGREMNLSETAFLHPQDDGFSLRWFTPQVEVDLCGHATLASAHVLWTEGHYPSDRQVNFYTRSGLLTATYDQGWIALNFPATPAEAAIAPNKLLNALGVEATYIGKTQFDYLVEVASEEVLRRLKPDFKQLATLSVRGIIVTSPCQNSEYDFASRFFAPAAGIDEDPVTGSAHCCLAPYWGDRLHKTELTGYQASARGGVVRVTCEGDRVILKGRAVTVLRGNLLV